MIRLRAGMHVLNWTYEPYCNKCKVCSVVGLQQCSSAALLKLDAVGAEAADTTAG